MVPSGQVVEKEASKEPGPGPEPHSWRCLVFYLCFYGFMSQMRPGESFITPYLLGPDKNFTREQVTNEVIPVLSYSYLVVLVPVFLLTDYLRYKPVLLLQGLSYVCVWLLLLLGHSVLHMQLMEVCYSITMAARIAYSSYIFSLVRPARYQRMASYSRTAVLLGVFTSSVLGQLLVSVGQMSFSMLNYISLAFLTFSLVLALFLRRPKRSLFFNRSAPARGASPSELDQMHPGPDQPVRGKLGRALGACRDSFLAHMLWDLVGSARRPQLRLWSLWWVFNSAGYYLVVYYVHVLWNKVLITASSTQVYNGAADAASTLLGAITSFAAGFVNIRWALWSKVVIASILAVQAGLVFLMTSTKDIWLCYAAYVLFRGAYQFLVPIATFQIASSLSKELCALVFGVNTFLATILKTTITLIVSDKRGLGLSVHCQVNPISHGPFREGSHGGVLGEPPGARRPTAWGVQRVDHAPARMKRWAGAPFSREPLCPAEDEGVTVWPASTGPLVPLLSPPWVGGAGPGEAGPSVFPSVVLLWAESEGVSFSPNFPSVL
ncbi:solute carrier family 19 member 1, transcript variant X2 [Ictidomys tridecemlineatus]|uniref:reduced folate transporter isoform X1 n=1 Tax=Ictidomys tridecemlineatus TaxID=43179 RepID=UPI000B540FAA|nr:reduced folate transporter isoform X1 [Ictidomys tridecemlineatus]XP_021575728.1 reduced folate transporter isoform X1 [Ictidomys tridecemlineatus]XP_040143076.1 reduced folate transporter isoform X1 [Ictidomys tridecemlineatus]XP_040143077.1 reduced folate transporter isoform X1 [Ictidomys tridecemlineatus]KAG3284147.1 solute carrier family 19 member 1, transcript variant X1 [Ictidomys tridecemlineatus]KAG3284148.1 solute carrier family 19 member 1, transcript variant X2 [Ictidomys tridece